MANHLSSQIRDGMSVGHAPNEPQWTPDMRKDDAQITEVDRVDAKRRIQGQVSESAEDSGSGLDSPPELQVQVHPPPAA